MAFVGTYRGGSSAAVVWAAGDVLVAVQSVSRVNDRVPTLSGWDLRGEARLPNEWAQVLDQVTVWTRRMESAGSGMVSVDLREDNSWSLDSAELTVLRYSASFVREVSSRRIQNERPVWAGSSVTAAGDVVHVGLLSWPSTPVDTTERELGDTWVVADRATTGSVGPVFASSTRRTDGMTWTLHLAAVPLVPVPVLAGLPSGVEVGAPVELSWQSIPGQTAYTVRRSQGGAHQYWSGSAWQASEVRLTGSGSSAQVSLPAGSWVLSVRASVGSTDSGWSDGRAVSAASPPGQPSVSVSSWSVRRPTITVTGSAGAGATLAGYRIEVVQAGQVIESTLSVSGVWRPERIPDGPTIVRAAIVQNGDQMGPWREVAGTVLVPPVPAPVVEASVGWLSETATPDAPLGLPGMRMTITTSLPGAVPFEVERDGVAFAAGTITTSSDVEDYSVGGAYRVRVGDPAHDPVEWSEWVSVVTPTELDQTHWIISVQYPELSVFVGHHEYDEVAPDLRSQVSAYLDGGREHITYGVPLDARRRVQVGVRSRVGWDRLRTLLSSGLLLRMGWGPATDGTPTPTDLFRVEGFDPKRFIPTRNIDMWRVDFDIIPQDS